MPGKRESLRRGDVVELKPGIRGRLNFQDQTLELSDGKVLPISDAEKRDLFPANEQSLKQVQSKEAIESQVKQTPGGEFFHQLGQSSGIGGIKDWANRFLLNKEEYGRRKQAEQEVSQRISEESPYISGAATAASFIPDLYLTRGMSAAKAAPLITAASAGSKIIDEPLQVAGEAGLAAVGGKFIDKLHSGLSNVAARRSASRAIPEQKALVQQQNAEGLAKVAEQNLKQKQAYNALSQSVENENAARLHQHNLALTDRQNRMLKEQSAFEQKKALRDAEIVRLKNKAELDKSQRSSSAAKSESEYRLAKEAAEQENKLMDQKFKSDQEQYQKALKELPSMQAKAQQEYSENVVKNAEAISKAFPKNSKIFSSQLGIPEFIDESINKSALAGSREAGQVTKILNSLFPEGETLTSGELVKRYKSLEGAIQKSNPEVKQILNEFKESLGNRITPILADNMAFERVMPSLRKQIEKDIQSVVKTLKLPENGLISQKTILDKALNNAKNKLNGLSPERFMEKMQSGEVREKILSSLLNPRDFEISLGVSSPSPKVQKMLERVYSSPSQKYDLFIQSMTNKIDRAMANAELKMIATDVDAASRLGGKVKKTFGMAEPVPSPIEPVAPQFNQLPSAPQELPPIPGIQIPPPINPPQAIPLPNKPVLMAEPGKPIPQTFTPQAEPVLPQPQGMAERLGDLMEKPLIKGKANLGNVAKLGLLKYALGKAALPVEAAGLAGYGALKALTAPGAEAARMTFKQAGIEAVAQWAQKYPSYDNGILQSPQDRRAFTKEIEDSYDIPIEQKAVIQSKINRGKPLQERL